MRIAVIGAGFTGLTAGYFLSKRGHQVLIFEKEKFPGGLAAGFKKNGWQWPVEHFFHHLFTSDSTAKNLLSELGLFQKLVYFRPKTSIFYQEKISQFDSPFSLLTFPFLSITEKLQTGLVTAFLKMTTNGEKFEKTTAFAWLKKHYGKRPFEILWKPLLEGKFAKKKEEISMSWFWARIKKRSQKLGYLQGGFRVLIDKLTQKIKENDGKIFLKKEIKSLKSLYNEFDKIIITTPVSSFLRMAPELPKEYKNNLQKLEMLGALNLILVLKEKFLIDGTYWLNINEKNFPFVAVVEHTNFINPVYYGGNHILYVGGYYPQNHRYFKMTKTQIFKEFLPYLLRINPNFQFSITDYYLFKNQFAQPIVSTHYSKLIPSCQTPIPNVYLASMQQIYPWDRGINYSVEMGKKVANEPENF